MKKIILIFVFVTLIILGFFRFRYVERTVCFGDVCPQNGGTYLFYRYKFTEDQCLKIGGQPIVGYGWSRVYAGCSPKTSK